MGLLTTFVFVDDPSVTIDTTKLTDENSQYLSHHCGEPLLDVVIPIIQFAEKSCGGKLMAYITWRAWEAYDNIAQCVSGPVVLYFMYEEMWPFKAQLDNGKVRFFCCEDEKQWGNKMRLRMSQDKAVEKKIETLHVDGTGITINVNRFKNAVKKNQIVWAELTRSHWF